MPTLPEPLPGWPTEPPFVSPFPAAGRRRVVVVHDHLLRAVTIPPTAVQPSTWRTSGPALLAVATVAIALAALALSIMALVVRTLWRDLSR